MDAKISALEDINHGRVSIHAPVMDANSAAYWMGAGARFNPRARDGRESEAWNV